MAAVEAAGRRWAPVKEMLDLPYILTHPLLQEILKRIAELKKQVKALPEGSPAQTALNKRIQTLQRYSLPKPTKKEQETEYLPDRRHKRYIARGGLRHRFLHTWRGRPGTIDQAIRAALEDKLADSGLTWREVFQRYGLKRQNPANMVRRKDRLKKTLHDEGLPGTAQEYRRRYSAILRARAILVTPPPVVKEVEAFDDLPDQDSGL